MAQVLLSPLSWGLGHAMRDIPIIKTLIAHDHDVTIAACGNALTALKQEFPQCRFIEFEAVSYTHLTLPTNREV